MALQIYNTLTRMKETFVAQEPGKVKIYVCGPTVYDYIHIGNARPMIFFDVVRAYFENQGNDVNYVVNFTDVDDKMIRKAEQTGTTVPEVAEKFINAYYEDLDGLGIPRATLNPRVTDNMESIIEFIQELIDRDFAYENGGDVFYRTRKFDDYGKLSQQNLDELQFGIRIEVDKRKETRRTSSCGKPRSRERSTGAVHGATAARAGISSAPPWLAAISGIPWISTAAARICSSRTMNAKWRSPRH